MIQARSNVSVDKPDLVRDKRVLIIDGPTLTHGEMGYGSGIIAAQRYGAAEIVDPRPSARGSLSKSLVDTPGSAERYRQWVIPMRNFRI